MHCKRLAYSCLQFVCHTSGSSGWNDGAGKTGLGGENINLDGWVSARVVDLTSVDLGNTHDCSTDGGVSCENYETQLRATNVIDRLRIWNF